MIAFDYPGDYSEVASVFDAGFLGNFFPSVIYLSVEDNDEAMIGYACAELIELPKLPFKNDADGTTLTARDHSACDPRRSSMQEFLSEWRNEVFRVPWMIASVAQKFRQNLHLRTRRHWKRTSG